MTPVPCLPPPSSAGAMAAALVNAVVKGAAAGGGSRQIVAAAVRAAVRAALGFVSPPSADSPARCGRPWWSPPSLRWRSLRRACGPFLGRWLRRSGWRPMLGCCSQTWRRASAGAQVAGRTAGAMRVRRQGPLTPLPRLPLRRASPRTRRPSSGLPPRGGARQRQPWWYVSLRLRVVRAPAARGCPARIFLVAVESTSRPATTAGPWPVLWIAAAAPPPGERGRHKPKWHVSLRCGAVPPRDPTWNSGPSWMWVGGKRASSSPRPQTATPPVLSTCR